MDAQYSQDKKNTPFRTIKKKQNYSRHKNYFKESGVRTCKGACQITINNCIPFADVSDTAATTLFFIVNNIN